MKEYAFGIDLGGTTAKIGLFTTSGALLEKWEVPTDTSNAGEHILENLAAAVLGKMKEQSIDPEQGDLVHHLLGIGSKTACQLEAVARVVDLVRPVATGGTHHGAHVLR